MCISDFLKIVTCSPVFNYTIIYASILLLIIEFFPPFMTLTFLKSADQFHSVECHSIWVCLMSPRGWIQIICFGQENTDIIFSGDRVRVLICLISGDTDLDYLVRWSLPL